MVPVGLGGEQDWGKGRGGMLGEAGRGVERSL